MTRARTNADQAHTESVESIPHIIPGVLYPAVAGKLLDGSTSHSGNYGTAQADGYSYYYTDIKGSKPIKDPRIGGHFGSQRHMFTSIQLLEQETATHGKNVYSVDGREWIRVVDGTGTWVSQNNAEGAWLFQNGSDCTGMVIEITGYFNDINTLNYTYSNNPNDIDIKVNGTMSHEGHTTCAGNASVETPLGARYVRSASLSNFGSTVSTSLGTSPAINTIHIECTNGSSEYWRNFGIELIAQDTTSTANKSKIQIPSQNVVSYGKKFTVSGTPHYDPFNGFTSGTDISSNIDTATSLGMSNWKVSSTWYRPFNGGRVVKWVDSSGNIKTSVTMMPPNAQNVGSVASNAIDLSSSQTNDDTINFNTSAIDHSLSEVAKTFHWREFGNGAANGGTGGSYADASMLNTDDDIAYVMDDGLTSLSGKGWKSHATYGLQSNGANESVYLTFIGTGISWKARSVTHGGNDEFRWFVDGVEVKVYDGSGTTSEYEIIAQNLPYGTHIVEIRCVAQANNADQSFHEFTFHQPKKPPIPEDAVVIVDYMLMADYVQNTANGNEKISKGVRACSQSRDIFYNEIHGFTTSFYDTGAMPGMGYLASSSNTSNVDNNVYELPAFGTIFYVNGHTSQTKNDLWIDDTDVAQSGTTDGNHGDISYPDAAVELGLHKFQVLGNSGQDYSPYIGGLGFKIASPTHTSSHYQTFETPFLHELVGGDRNMEQNNLVVTPDGKTWDEVTRDTSYLGNIRFHASDDGQDANPIILSDFRGTHRTNGNYYQKNFAIAYDRFICLKEGEYEIKFSTYNNTTSTHAIKINGTDLHGVAMGDTEENATTADAVVSLKRGDYVQIRGKFWNQEFTHFSITEI